MSAFKKNDIFSGGGDHAGNYSSSAESRKSGYGSTKSAPAATASKSVSKAASVPLPTKRPAPNTASRSPAPAANPSVDKQYATYSTSGGPQSAQKRAAPSTFPARPSVTGGNGISASTSPRSRSQMNDYKQKESQYSSDMRSVPGKPIQGPAMPKKKFSLLNAMKQDTRKYMK